MLTPQPLASPRSSPAPRSCIEGRTIAGIIGVVRLPRSSSRWRVLVGRLAPVLGAAATSAKLLVRIAGHRCSRSSSGSSSRCRFTGGERLDVTAMALEGTLRDFSLADIFQLIGLQRKTGVLTLRGKDDTVTVTFLDGKVVGADSLNHRLENRLGHVLIKSELLTQDQLNRALEIQKETLQRLGFILTHYGIISADSLKQAIQLQILQIVYRLFRWKDGDYHFSQETTIEYDRDNVVPITAESILMEGARMIDEWPIIEKRIRSYDMVFRKKLTDQEIVVVGAEDADEIDFDADATPSRRRKQARQRQDPHLAAKRKRSTTWSTAR